MLEENAFGRSELRHAANRARPVKELHWFAPSQVRAVPQVLPPAGQPQQARAGAPEVLAFQVSADRPGSRRAAPLRPRAHGVLFPQVSDLPEARGEPSSGRGALRVAPRRGAR